MVNAIHSSAAARALQSRLLVQDPRAWEEAQVPSLRDSRELGSSTNTSLDSATALQTWNALQLTPEQVAAQSVQLREAYAKAQNAANLADVARAEVVRLETELARMQAHRWQYAVVAGAGVAILSGGWYWLSERKKRLAVSHVPVAALKETGAALFSPQVPLTELPSQRVEFSTIDPPVQESRPDSAASSLLYDNEHRIATVEAVRLPFERPEPWWKRLVGRPNADAAPLTEIQTQAIYSSTLNPNLHTQIDPYEGTTELEDMQLQEGAGYDPEQANLELLSQTRIQPASSEDAMDHLLELRMAVQALCALEQSQTAKKLLQEHIDAVPQTSSWAYMEYLGLCMQLGQRDEFDSMRSRYRLHFNRLAPEWQEPHAFEQSLEVYERPVLELCTVWHSPEKTRELIATWLLGALPLRRAFQLPAHHDLLDLYEMLEFYGEDSFEIQDFVPTVSLLDLDFEFAVDVTIGPQSAADALRAVPTVKTGNFDVDFNLTLGNAESGLSPSVSGTTETEKFI